MTSPKYRAERKGISTIFGVLFLIVILATTVVPMLFYFQQVNGYYDREVADTKLQDQERDMENLEFYVVGHDEDTDINMYFKNKGAVPVNITRIWIKTLDLSSILVLDSSGMPGILPLFLPVATNKTKTYDFSSSEAGVKYALEAMSERGKRYESQSNPLKRGDTGGGWDNDVTHFLIQTIVIPGQGNVDLYVSVTGPTPYPGESRSTMQASPNNIFNPSFAVPYPGPYTIMVTQELNRSQELSFPPRVVVLTWDYFSAVCKFDFTKPLPSPPPSPPPFPETFYPYTSGLPSNKHEQVSSNKDGAPDISLAESFTVTNSFTVTGINLSLAKQSASASGTLYASIYDQLPYGTGNVGFVAGGAINLASLSTSSHTYRISITQPAKLETGSGKKYYLVLNLYTPPSQQGEDVYWYDVDRGSYSGLAYQKTTGDWGILDLDFKFGLWGYNP